MPCVRGGTAPAVFSFMRERDLRRLFVGLAAAAAPFELGAAGCGGTVTDSSGRAAVESSGGTGGVAPFVGKRAPGTGGFTGTAFGTGGYPFAPGVGGYPFTPGVMPGSGGSGGYPFAPGAGGVPIYTGVVDAGVGGYLGMGGALIGTGGAVDAGPPQDAAIAPDAGNFCMAGVASGCAVFCIPMPNEILWDAQPAGCARMCSDPAVVACDPLVTSNAEWIRCFLGCARRPEGLVEMSPAADGAVRAYFQEMSRLEAASVPAFRVLARELRAHGAPRALIRAARRAARDEIRHARLGKLLAERFGGRYVAPRIATQPVRSIEAIATDNAVEGCVRETFGALLATWQGRVASDPVVRRVMRSIAVDETRHAALNLRVAAWADRKMDAAARARVRTARRLAGERVLYESSYEPSPALAAIVGVPRSADARRLAAAMHAELWS
jgi:hypothetical protein